MILLTSTSDLIRVVTGQSGTVSVHASWMDLAAGVVSAGRTNTPITTATTTTVVGVPGASTTRNVKYVTISNTHASTSMDVKVEHYDGTNAVPLAAATLLPGEKLVHVESDPWIVIRSDGMPKSVVTGLPSGGASTVAQSATFASDIYVTGSGFPCAGRIAAGSFMRWRISMSKTAAGIAAPTFNIRYGTAGAVGDTSRVLFTGPAQSAAADTAILEITAQFRVVGASAVLQGELELHHNLAVTGFVTVNPAGLLILSTTSATFDSTPAGSIIGLSMNGGASAAWTVTSCVLDAVNLIN